MSGENADCNNALIRMFPQIDMPSICDFIDATPFISELQKEFYKHYLTARYELIIKPAYNQLQMA